MSHHHPQRTRRSEGGGSGRRAPHTSRPSPSGPVPAPPRRLPATDRVGLDCDEDSPTKGVEVGSAPVAGQGIALLTSPVRRRIVEHLAALPRLDVEGGPTRDRGLTAAELGEVLGLHSTTVRFHLDQLLAAGLVSAHFVRSGGAGRPAKRYVIVEGELALADRARSEGSFQVLAALLAEALDPENVERVTPEEAGEQWVRQRIAARAETSAAPGQARPATTTGEWLGKVGDIVDLLEEWGYTPELAVDGGDVTLTLRDCPFLDLARAHPAVVCGVHRGLLKGALREAGEHRARVSLRPLVGERTCHALLSRDAGGADSAPTSTERTP